MAKKVNKRPDRTAGSGAGQPDEKPVRAEKSTNPVDRMLRLLSSVRFGIVILVLLLVCCIVGMVVMQRSVGSFGEYYESLTPAQRELYSTLGLFDIYHSWYFTALLAIMALNIVLSSIDRFPTAWGYLRGPKLAASPKFIQSQMFNRIEQTRQQPAEAAEEVVTAWRSRGYRPRVTEEDGRITIFAQRNVWNRLGAYAVHVSLLIIFVGGFLTSRYGVGGVMEISPGTSSNGFFVYETGATGETSQKAQLPFTVECTDLQQQLVRPEGGLDAMNTVDWLSYVNIKDGSRETRALVHLNSPFDYRGYRFFQSSFQPRGNARQITVSFDNGSGVAGPEVTIERGGSAEVPGIGHVAYVDFHPDIAFEKGKPVSESDDYNNPAAELKVTAPDGRVFRAFALAAGAEKNAAPADLSTPIARLKTFEKVATSHTLSVQYDPGREPVYVGFTLLAISLCGVFFFSHKRVWAVIEPDTRGATVYLAGNTNRNRPSFEAQFNALANIATGGLK